MTPAPGCARCGYRLTGLPPGGLCPECGLPVAVSRRPATDLSSHDPARLRRVRLGLWLLAPLTVVGPPLSGLGHALPTRDWFGLDEWDLTLGSSAVLLIWLTLATTLLSGPTGRADVDRRTRRERWSTRLLPLLPATAWVLLFVGVGTRRSTLPLVAAALLSLGGWLLWVLLSRLAQRLIGDRDAWASQVATGLRRMAHAVAVCVAYTFVAGFVLRRLDLDLEYPSPLMMMTLLPIVLGWTLIVLLYFLPLWLCIQTSRGISRALTG